LFPGASDSRSPHRIQIRDDGGGYASRQKWSRDIPFPGRVGNCDVLVLEAGWVWVPCLAIGTLLRLLRQIKVGPKDPSKGRDRTKYFNPSLAWEARQRARA
jgi:hypothetical protein